MVKQVNQVKQYGFYIDESLCSGCKACAMACMDKNNLDDGRMFRNVHEFVNGGVFEDGGPFMQNVGAYWVSLSCNHCARPKCVQGCPTKAMNKDENGIVSVNQKRCVGCKYCVWNCPYHAPKYDESRGKMSKCDFCKDLLAKGEEPACVAACPLGLIHFGPIERLREQYGGNADLAGLPASTVTGPNLVIKPHKNALRKTGV